MFLGDIGKNSTTRFKKINRYLKENHGITLSSELDDESITAAFQTIYEEITEFKMQGHNSLTSPEISKRLLVLEGLRTLMEGNVKLSPVFQSVLRNLVDYVVEEVSLEYSGHTPVDFDQVFDETVRNAMREYRSSHYRFPDSVVEQELRSEAKFQLKSNGHAPAIEESDENDVWAGVGRRSGAGGGHVPSMQGKDAAVNRMGGNLKLDLEPIDNDSGLVRDPRTGRMVPDPFAAKQRNLRSTGVMQEDEFDVDNTLANHRNSKAQHVTQPRKEKPELAPGKSVNPRTGEEVVDPFTAHKLKMRSSSAMKESANLVKRLRHLLETEVNQAEVMMAAKGFAQELQEMVEKIGRLQNEDLPPVTDQMRQTYGTDSASAFQSQIYAALQGVMDALYTAKSQVDAAVDSMAATGQVGAQVDMDVDVSDELSDLPSDDLDATLDDIGDEDEFGSAEHDEPLGRAQKESVDLQKKVLEMQKLVARAKKLKESKK